MKPRASSVVASRRELTVTSADRTRIAQLVSARTGLPQAEAQQRVDAAITQAKAAADEARKAAAKLAFWFAAALLAGALSAGIAAVEGGRLRDDVDEVGRRRPLRNPRARTR